MAIVWLCNSKLCNEIKNTLLIIIYMICTTLSIMLKGFHEWLDGLTTNCGMTLSHLISYTYSSLFCAKGGNEGIHILFPL